MGMVNKMDKKAMFQVIIIYSKFNTNRIHKFRQINSREIQSKQLME